MSTNPLPERLLVANSRGPTRNHTEWTPFWSWTQSSRGTRQHCLQLCPGRRPAILATSTTNADRLLLPRELFFGEGKCDSSLTSSAILTLTQLPLPAPHAPPPNSHATLRGGWREQFRRNEIANTTRDHISRTRIIHVVRGRMCQDMPWKRGRPHRTNPQHVPHESHRWVVVGWIVYDSLMHLGKPKMLTLTVGD